MAKPRQVRREPQEPATDSQRETEESLRRFRLAMDASADIIVLIDRATMRYVDVNDTACTLLGYSRQEMLAMGPQDLLPSSRAELEKSYDELIANPSRESGMKTSYRRKDGSLLPFESTRRVLRSGDGYIIAAISRDIRERLAVEDALRESEERFRQTFELAALGLAHVDLDGHFMRVNRSLCEILGYEERELIGRSVKELSHPEDRDLTDSERRRVRTEKVDAARFEKRYVRKDGAIVWVELVIALARGADARPLYEIAIFDDISERKKVEAALAEQRERLQIGQSAVRLIIMDWDVESDRLSWTDAPEWLRGPLPVSGTYPLFKDQVHPEDRERFLAVRDAALESLRDGSIEFRFVRTDGQVLWLLSRQKVFADASGKAKRMLAALLDITERKRAEKTQRESEARFRSLTDLSSDWYWQQDAEFRLTSMSGQMGERTGLDASSYIGRKRWDRPALNLTEEGWARHRAQLERHEPFRDFEMQRATPDGKSRWVSLSGEPIFDDDGRFTGYRGVGKDITGRKEAEAELRRAHNELERKAAELERSNAELGQFAYVASHDLQEPLRMVSSYTQLLVRRYGERFDGDAREFMAYVVDGAARMKQLIEDLLAYSRVGTRGREFHQVAVETSLRRAIGNLRAAIEEAGAAVTYDALPTLEADDLQLTQLFQNLIGNALKFRSASVPRIHVSSKEEENEWEFAVHDNGIGIEAQYFERIFMVFQQLHNKGEYPGTGIGLAICKKVVERHGGSIWVTSGDGVASQPGGGSTFHFTLLKKQGEA